MPKKDKSIKKVLEEIENKAIESRYTNMYDWQRRELSKEDLFEYDPRHGIGRRWSFKACRSGSD